MDVCSRQRILIIMRHAPHESRSLSGFCIDLSIPRRARPRGRRHGAWKEVVERWERGRLQR